MNEANWICLIRITTKEGVRSHLIEKPSFTIGRTQEADLPILDGSVSRVHLAIEIRNDQIWISDKQSANGTFVNGRQIESGQTLIALPEDEIRLGTHQDTFRLLAIPKPFELLGEEAKKKDLVKSMEGVAKQFEVKTRERVEHELRQARAEAEQVLSSARKDAEVLRTQALMDLQQRKQALESELAKLRQDAQVAGAEERLRARKEADLAIAEAQKRIQRDYDENAQRIEAQLKNAHDQSAELLEQAEIKSRMVMSEARDEASLLRKEVAEEARRVQQETLRKTSEAMAGVQERIQREVAERRAEMMARARQEAEAEKESILRESAAEREKVLSESATAIERARKAASEEKRTLEEEIALMRLTLTEEVVSERKALEDKLASERKNMQEEMASERKALDGYLAQLRTETLSFETHAKKERERLHAEIIDQTQTLEESVTLAREKAERERDRVMKEVAAQRAAIETAISENEVRLKEMKSEIQQGLREKQKAAAEVEKLGTELVEAKKLLEQVKELEERRTVAEAQFKEFTANRSEGMAKLERELKEAREKGLVELDTRRKSQEAELAKERLQLMERIQKLIVEEEKKYDQTKRMRALELTEELYDTLVPKLDGWVKNPREATLEMKEAIGQAVTQNMLKNTSSLQAPLTQPVAVVSQEVRDRKYKRGAIAAGAVMLIVAVIWGKPILHKLEDMQKDSYAMNQIEQRRIQSIYSPQQTEDFRGSYTDNVLYMRGYFETKTDQNYIEKWTLRLNDLNLLRPMDLNEDDIIKFIAKETNLIQRLGNNRRSIDALFLKEGLERMRAAEEEDLADMVKALKGEANFKKLRALEKDFLKDYLAKHPVTK